MFEAQLLIAQTDPGTQVWSPWFSRRGDNAIITLEVVAISAASIDVKVATKNTEDVGDGNLVGATITRNTVGISSDKWGPASGGGGTLLELVRYRFSVTEDAAAWVLFRMLPPVWFDSAKV